MHVSWKTLQVFVPLFLFSDDVFLFLSCCLVQSGYSCFFVCRRPQPASIENVKEPANEVNMSLYELPEPIDEQFSALIEELLHGKYPCCSLFR